MVEHAEWKTVVQEIQDFIDADDVCTVLSVESTPVVITNRLTQFNCPEIEKATAQSSGAKPLELSEIIIIGNCFDQIRFSEITLDMFRILQCVERDPQDNFGNTTVGLRPQRSLENGDGCDAPVTGVAAPSERKCKNPHKYLLYRPTFSQFNCYMAAGFKDLPSDGVLLLYLSADGLKPASKLQNDRKPSLVTASRVFLTRALIAFFRFKLSPRQCYCDFRTYSIVPVIVWDWRPLFTATIANVPD